MSTSDNVSTGNVSVSKLKINAVSSTGFLVTLPTSILSSLSVSADIFNFNLLVVLSSPIISIISDHFWPTLLAFTNFAVLPVICKNKSFGVTTTSANSAVGPKKSA